jgi:uncharacterized SAM-binding protein YcdF (DUF218 family)
MKGWICLTTVGFCLVLAGYMLFLNLGGLLTVCDAPGKTELIISTSGAPGRIAKAAELLRLGYGERVLVTTAVSYGLMVSRGVAPEKILRASWSAESTYQEGLLIKELLAGRGYTSALVVSDPFHLFRVKWTLRHLFAGDGLRFLFISTDSSEYRGFWWDNRSSRLFVLSELPKIVYYWIWHGLLGIADDPPWALELEWMYLKLICKNIRVSEARGYVEKGNIHPVVFTVVDFAVWV